jgi:hypothetical protein
LAKHRIGGDFRAAVCTVPFFFRLFDRRSAKRTKPILLHELRIAVSAFHIVYAPVFCLQYRRTKNPFGLILSQILFVFHGFRQKEKTRPFVSAVP